MTLRLVCGCGRNVADATRDARVMKHELRGLRVEVRTSVANHGGDRRHQEVLAAPTYRWACRCGRVHTIRHDRLVEAYIRQPSARVVRLTLGRDL